MNIYIMRHGETAWNKERKIQGSADIPLTSFGVELAGKTRDGFAADGIRFQRIYSSPLIRAVKTAGIINEKQGAELIVDNRIREMSFGMYEGSTIHGVDENIKNCFDNPVKYHADPTGENYSDLFARIRDFMDNELIPLEKEGVYENVLVVCHGAAIRAFLSSIKGLTLEHFWDLHQPNCSVNQLLLRDGSFSVVQENIFYYDIRLLKH